VPNARLAGGAEVAIFRSSMTTAESASTGWIDWAHVKQKRAQQAGCCHGSQQTEPAADSSHPDAGTKDQHKHARSLTAEPLNLVSCRIWDSP
jgi:hypothetical protein